MGDKAFCVHGHFYQPHREDPLTGEIPLESGATPYRNWNELIHDHCYRPNAELGNFKYISFDIGPTLNQWMATYDPQVLSCIIAQDRSNVEHYGVGNAIALSYNHTILPLSSYPDKITQVVWGIDEFIYRFKRKPLGMWLPETAVDLETLQVLAECGIEFTILAPWQAETENLDITQPYWVNLPGGKRITVFFFCQDLSMRVSFDPGSTVNAESFVHDILMPKYKQRHPANNNSNESELLLIVSDGELYGHHQPYRDKFLAHLMNGGIYGDSLWSTFPALWLKQHPPKNSISIRQNTSWSCHHGIARWKEACDCTPNGGWKWFLRKALNNMAYSIDEQYLTTLQPFISNPWRIRHHYVRNKYSGKKVEELIVTMIDQKLDTEKIEKIKILLAAQYERQRMFTSCGWFFDNFERIEPRNNIAYAARAVWLTYLGTGVDLSQQSLDWLKLVKSSSTGINGSDIFNYHFERAKE